MTTVRMLLSEIWGGRRLTYSTAMFCFGNPPAMRGGGLRLSQVRGKLKAVRGRYSRDIT